VEMFFTAGFHSGQVLIGGLGCSRKELGYWGDTMNTASRIQAACRSTGTNCLFSQSFMQLLAGENRELLKNTPFFRIRNVRLRGKKAPITLYSFSVETRVPVG
jgi:adenylate cyclase